MRANQTLLNKDANDRATRILSQSSFKVPAQFIVDNKDDRRLWPLEYRGANLSNCMYTTAASFSASRRHVKPTSSRNPDLNYPVGGGETN